MPAKAYSKNKRISTTSKSELFNASNLKLLSWGKQFMYLMHKMHIGLNRHMTKALDTKKGISYSQFLILLSISARDEDGSSTLSPLHKEMKDCDLSQSRLAEMLQVTQASISRHIRILKRLHLVNALHAPRNRRTKVLTLTESGETALMKAKLTLAHELIVIANAISQQDRNALTRAYQSIIKHLS